MFKNLKIQFVLIFLTTFLYFCANIQRVAVPGTIFDLLQNDLATNASSITALSASYMYFYAICQLYVGFCVAKFGGFKVLNIGSIIFAIGGLIFPFATSLPILYISRALIGVGSSTFYLGMIAEIEKSVHKNNFGIILSLVLLVGYIGGVLAGAPFFLVVDEIGWRNSFLILAILALIIMLLLVVLYNFLPVKHTNSVVKVDFSIYKKVLSNKNNILLYTFGCFNYALYFIFQTVIGKKFLEDFASISSYNAALTISCMGFVYAISGPFVAFLSRSFLNRRTVFFKIAATNTLFVILLLLLFILFDFKSDWIILLFLLLSLFAAMSPLLIPLIYDFNTKKEASISISIMTCLFFFIVAILANIIGWILYFYTPVNMLDKAILHSNEAYCIIFSFLLVLAVISWFCAFKIKDTNLT